MSLKDFFIGEKFVLTTVELPVSVRDKVKELGMTFGGCIVEGLKAIEERKKFNATMPELEIRIARMSALIEKQSRRIEQLEKGVKH